MVVRHSNNNRRPHKASSFVGHDDDQIQGDDHQQGLSYPDEDADDDGVAALAGNWDDIGGIGGWMLVRSNGMRASGR